MSDRLALRISGADVRVGDEFPALWFMRGCPGVVKRLHRYSGPLLDVLRPRHADRVVRRHVDRMHAAGGGMVRRHANQYRRCLHALIMW